MRRVRGGVMRISNVEVPASAAVELALSLREAGNNGLAWHIEVAVDNVHDELGPLLPRDREALLVALNGRNGPLAELRRTLETERHT